MGLGFVYGSAATAELIINVPSGENATIKVAGSDAVTMNASGIVIVGAGGVVLEQININDSSADPSATNGEFSRNGTDVKVYSGGAVRNFSDITAAVPLTPWTENIDAATFNLSNVGDLELDKTGSGRLITMQRNEALADDTAIGEIKFKALDGVPALEDYGNIIVAMESDTAGSEDGSMFLQTAVAGTHRTTWLSFNDAQAQAVNFFHPVSFLGGNVISIFDSTDAESISISKTLTQGTVQVADKLVFQIGADGQLEIDDGAVFPTTDNDVNLGKAANRYGALYTLTCRLPTTVSDSTTEIKSDSSGIEYHVLNEDVHEFFSDGQRVLSIGEVGNETFMFYSDADHTVVSSTGVGVIYDVDSNEQHSWQINGITRFDITADGPVLPIFTNSNRPSPSAAGRGGMIYNRDDEGINVSDGSNWRAPSGGWVNT